MRAEHSKRLLHWARFALLALAVQLAGWSPAHAALVVNKLSFQDVNATTRIVLDMTEAPQDLSVEDLPGKPMTISFRGMAKDAVKPLNKKFSWPNLSGIFVENRNGKVQIFIKRNVLGTVTVNREANRLVVNIPHYYYRVNEDNEIASGVRYLRFSQNGPQGPVRINVLEIDPRNPAVDIMPTLASNRMGAKTNVANMVAANEAVAGVNGSFFKQDVGIPLGILIINQELVSGPIYERVAMGITPTNELVMDRIRLGGDMQLPGGGRLRVHNINQPRIQPHETVVYSARWGKTAPAIPDGGYQIQLRRGQITGSSTTTPLDIPRDGVVISGPGTPELAALASLPMGQPVQLNIYTIPDWSSVKHAIGGGPWLVKNGQPYVDAKAQHFTSSSLGFREPRTAVGITPEGKMLLVTVDGRQPKASIGMTLHELSHLMKKLGAVQAMNLDGGSSTQMAVYGKMVNTPSAGNVGVSNSLIVRMSNGGNVAVQDR